MTKISAEILEWEDNSTFAFTKRPVKPTASLYQMCKFTGAWQWSTWSQSGVIIPAR